MGYINDLNELLGIKHLNNLAGKFLQDFSFTNVSPYIRLGYVCMIDIHEHSLEQKKETNTYSHPLCLKKELINN